jgi:tetratricopeptide (TPR) repeat protein
MAIFKCKYCGGDIQAETGAAFGTCDSCQSTSTLPKANEDRIVNLFNRANHFRRLNEFDKALATYENILTEESSNAEAHWGVVICRYGIEYVEDPKSGKHVPTCHRAQYASILTDADYLATLDNAPDSYTKSLYEEEAKIINDIQKRILAIANNEDPFDVFICYKETTDGGSRTVDSTLAEDIYDKLTKEGFKVFFAKITLEEKIGRQYEPYIFNALQTAKVMLVIGTKKEYLETIWVKNEWSRYLSLMKSDKTRFRLLIPCFRDMDAYDLPDELTAFQAVDMGKIGYIQDLVRGVKKVTGVEEAAVKQVQPITAAVVGGGADPLIRRAYLSIEDKEFGIARQLLDQALNIDPENVKAYVGLLLVTYSFTKEEQLGDSGEGLEKNNYYQRALRFANADYKRTLMGYLESSCNHVKERKEVQRKQDIVQKATEISKTIDGMEKAIEMLDTIQGFNDADILNEACKNNQQKYYSQAVRHAKNEQFEDAINTFRQLGQYKDSPEQLQRVINIYYEFRKKMMRDEETWRINCYINQHHHSNGFASQRGFKHEL